MHGRLDEHVISSEALRGNPLGDPHERPLWVYVPPGYDDEPERRFPSVYAIQGMAGRVDMWRNRSALRKTVLELFDELFASGEAPPCLVVFPDCFTALGGSQFLDSPAVGRYHTYLCDEVVAVGGRAVPHARRARAPRHHGQVERRLRRDGDPDAPPRTCSAGSPRTPATRSSTTATGASSRSARGRCASTYDGSFERFWEDFRSRPALTRESDKWLVNTYCMAACYSEGELPFDLETAELRPDVFARWLEWDPVRMVAGHAEALRGLKAVYIDSGGEDDYYLDLGALAFRRALAAIGVTDVFFELFPAAHAGIEYRYPLALRYLAERLAP